MSYPFSESGHQQSKKIVKGNRYYLAPSRIHGLGVYTGKSFKPDEPIEVGIKIHFGLFPEVTSYFGSYINHSWFPNTYLQFNGTDHLIHAKNYLSTGEELTLDYRQTPWYIMGPDPTWHR